MGLDIGGVYVVRFPNRGMNEFYGKHYGVILSKVSGDDKTLLIAPVTGKKKGRKYRGGITLDNFKYQTNPSYDSSFVYARKIQEVDKRRISSERKLKCGDNGNTILDKGGK
ncbi:type II toxin-antitoxin system PemK/MazF family toxin [Streptococcus cuniculi]|uniref:type II toxin-antitoxin system PemK/MazF family toxin n=1 Tax=Streptococcus cuniculi TaxID=1432788 RepID=UPI001D16605E|nr:type II toxin-antitoxin system PemK/MazF family toxin [Streptococcus cuniculi]